MSAHSHSHAHRPLNLGDVIEDIIQLTQARHLAWRCTGVNVWEAERQGARLQLESQMLLVTDAHGQVAGLLFVGERLTSLVSEQVALVDESRSELLAAMIEPQAVIDERAEAEWQRRRARLQAEREQEQRDYERRWSHL